MSYICNLRYHTIIMQIYYDLHHYFCSGTFNKYGFMILPIGPEERSRLEKHWRVNSIINYSVEETNFYPSPPLWAINSGTQGRLWVFLGALLRGLRPDARGRSSRTVVFYRTKPKSRGLTGHDRTDDILYHIQKEQSLNSHTSNKPIQFTLW